MEATLVFCNQYSCAHCDHLGRCTAELVLLDQVEAGILKCQQFKEVKDGGKD